MCESPPNKKGVRVIDDDTTYGPSVGDNWTLCGEYTASMLLKHCCGGAVRFRVDLGPQSQ